MEYLGTIGFISGMLAVGAFAFTSWKAYRVVKPELLKLFVTSFALFAVAMGVWAVAALPSLSADIRPLLFATDVLLLTATACMSFILLGGVRIYSATLFATLAAVLLAHRMSQYPPTGYVADGLLYFNLDGIVRTILVIAFALIWLPAMYKVANILALDRVLAPLGRVLTLCFILLTLVSATFLGARRPSVIIGLFLMITVLFAAMTVMNALLVKVHNSPVKKEKVHAAKRAATKSR